jgi:D-aminoacyl-tRNA deacylase
LIGIEVWFKVRENVNCFVWMQITLEATHHGPITNKPTMFLEIGSTEEYWKRQDAAQVMALVSVKKLVN